MSRSADDAVSLNEVADALARGGARIAWGEGGVLLAEGEVARGLVTFHISARRVSLPSVFEGEVPVVLVEMMGILPDAFVCPAERRGALVEFMGALNGEVAVGRFEFDRDAGRPRYRVTLVERGMVSAEVAVGAILDGLQVIEGYAAGIERVIAGEAPAHVYVDVLLEGEAVESLPAAARIWLLEWLSLATDAYIARDDVAGLTAVASLGQRLVAGAVG